MPFPDTLDAKPKIIFFTDFDGTITLADTNDHMTAEYGCGQARLREITDLIAHGKMTFRDGFQEELDSWNMPFPRVLEIMKRDMRMDPHFRDFLLWAQANRIPVTILSSGLVPVIQTLMNHWLGEDTMASVEIVANEPKLRAPENSFEKAGGWTIRYHDDSDFGHDKSLTIRPYAEAIALMENEDEKPTLLYAGDGVSDLSAARETDLLFAKAGKDLVGYCEREGIPFTTFENWSTILDETKDIFHGRKSVRKIAEEGLRRHRTNSIDADVAPPPSHTAS